MSLGSSRYHILLNGQGYLLMDESRTRKAQSPFTPRFATGDQSLGDLSFWQFAAVQGFTGGEGQSQYSSSAATRVAKANGWDMRDGKCRLPLAFGSVGTLDNAMSAAVASPFIKPKFIYYAGALWLVNGRSARTDNVVAPVKLHSVDGEPCIYELKIRDAIVFYRKESHPSSPMDASFPGATYLLGSLPNTGAGNAEAPAYIVKISDYEAPPSLTFPHAYYIASSYTSYDVYAHAQVTENSWLVVGLQTVNHMIVDIRLVTETGSTDWAGWNHYRFPLPLNTHGSYNWGPISGGIAVDSSGTVYIPLVYKDRSDLKNASTIVVRITSADLTTNRISAVDHIANFVCSSIHSVNGTIYMCGADMAPSDSGYYGHPCILQFPDTVIYREESLKSGFSGDYDGIILTPWASRTGLLFGHKVRAPNQVSGTDTFGIEQYQVVVKKVKTDGTVISVGVIPYGSLAKVPRSGAFADLGGRLYFADVTNGAIYASALPSASGPRGALQVVS